ncbi:MAG: hypothetical protein WCH98_02195 [Verrucomicrobiota bacterium]
MPLTTNLKKSLSESKLVTGIKSGNVAHYDPRSQIITLESYDVEDLKNGDDAKQKEFAAAVIHEFTHWIDHVSSLWGQRNLLAWFNGVAAWKGKDATQFSTVLAARQALKTIKYATYFTTIEIKDMAEARQGAPWLYQFTAGQTFDAYGKLNIEHPILFTRFATHSGKSIGRVPMSAGALLEVNAVAADLFFDMLHVAEARVSGDLVEIGIREKNVNDKYLDLLYSAEFVEYSVAAHCLANNVQGMGIFEAYRRAACLSEVAMNLPSAFFERIKLPEKCEAFADLHTRFLKTRDVGYAYWCLCQNATPDAGNDLEQWAEIAVANSGLPNRAAIAKAALTEMNDLLGNAPAGALGEHFRELVMFGISVFEKHGLSRIPDIYEIYHETEAAGKFPMTLLGDDTVVGHNHTWETMKPDGIEKWFIEMNDFDTWSETFESACTR